MNQTEKANRINNILIIGAIGILFVLFIRLHFNLQPNLAKIQQDYAEGRAINLVEGLDSEALKKILRNYYPDDKDITLIADSLSAKVAEHKQLENLGAINKRDFQILAPTAIKSPIGGKDFQSRLGVSRQRMGFDEKLYEQELLSPKHYPSEVGQAGSLSISGAVHQKEDGQPMTGILVQLRKHSQSLTDEIAPEENIYARTDANGKFIFRGLSQDSSYSVIPLKPGLEFGTRQGTIDGGLTKNLDFSFIGHPHKIRLIGSTVYSQLKDDKVLTVRTPKAFNQAYLNLIIIFFSLFGGLYIFWSYTRFFQDATLLAILMLLTGISLVILFSIQNPLQDTLYGYHTLWGIGLGLVGMVMVSYLPISKWYTRLWYFDILSNVRYKSLFKGQLGNTIDKNTYQLQGFTWLALGLIMALTVMIWGRGPEGSGVKVNLSIAGVDVQPSELTKYFLLVFFACFFAANEKNIRSLSDARWRFWANIGVLAGTLALILIYLKMGDMGPALVVCFTFLFFYSIARGNLIVTLCTGLIYALLLKFLPSPLLATIITLVIAIGWLIGKKLFQTTRLLWWWSIFAEAPVILMIIIAAFTFGDKIPSVGERLAQRKEMWLNPWNNNVEGGGGDHLAHAYWTLSSGGIAGQGPGKGFANTMPAAHTDMILPSIGEELGFFGLLSIFLLFGILIHRIILYARRAGQPFAFYLCTGIALSLGIQFFIIACGSIGLLPLTGISVPFLSYGKVSLIVNLAAMGIVIGVSRLEATEVQQKHIHANYDPVIFATIVSCFVGVIILTIQLLNIQLISSRKYIVQPARVLNRNGLPIYSYNPRIEIFTKALAAGNIYDRNNLVLATSSLETIRTNQDSLLNSGLSSDQLAQVMRKKASRYYPFEAHTFFWTGDFNTKLLWSQAGGYFAEARHLSELRGFDTKPEKSAIITTRFRPNRFSKPISKEVTVVAYDYSVLADMMKEGLESEQIASLRAKNRDIQLSIDASLQVAIQAAIESSEFKNKRVSVVVLDASTGDVLASAINPLPNLKAPDEMVLSEKEIYHLNHLIAERDLGMTYATAPGSTAKILTAMAAFNKLGSKASDIRYDRFDYIIRADEPKANVDMRKAIVESSNIYFIQLANDNKLDNEMADLYLSTGMNIDYVGGYYFHDTHTPQNRESFLKHWTDSSFVKNRDFYTKFQGKKKYSSEFSGLAWGQGQLTATPVSLARMAGTIANNGIFQPSRYILQKGGIKQKIATGIALAKETDYAEQLTSFMIDQSNGEGKAPKISISKVAGKSGTPERRINGRKRYDGWYVFFAPTPSGDSHTVTCVRIELGESSAKAIKLANEHIAPILKQKGYLGTF